MTNNKESYMHNSNRSIIVLNRMFAGEFLNDHIGHEIVNLYKDDSGRNYVYIQPYGTFERSHAGRIGSVLMVRGIPGKGALEVLGLATELEDIYDPSLSPARQWEIHEQFLRTQQVSYGGVSLLDIFDRSKEMPEKQPVYVSMRAGKVMRPNRPVYIVYGETDTIGNSNAVIVLLPHTNQAKCSLKQYFDAKNPDYAVLNSLLEMRDLWTVSTEPVTNAGWQEVKDDNFFDICGVADYELAFSNALAYYIDKYPELFIEFLNTRLNIKLSKPLTCLREWKNIDILIEDDDEIVVIENKITSKINGIIVKDGALVATQLKKYYVIALDRAAGEYLDKEATQKKTLRLQPKKVTCFILTPDYNPICMDEYDTEGFVCKQHYKQLFYSELYHFLKGRHPEDMYFQEFLKGMEKHTKLYHDDLFADTKAKFIKQIKRAISAK